MQKHENQKRHYTEEFKAEVVALCEKGDRSCRQVAEDLGVKYQTVCTWVQRAKKQKKDPGSLAPSEREELIRLRKENARLRMEREILKKAAAFFASENQ